MNLLNEYPKVRKILYAVQWVINGIFAVGGAFFVANGTAIENLPKWWVVALAVAPVLWTYLGLQAGANTPSNIVPPPYDPGDEDYVPQHRGEAGYAVLGALGMGLIVLSVILLVLQLLSVVAVGWVVLVVLFVIGLVLVWMDRGGSSRVF